MKLIHLALVAGVVIFGCVVLVVIRGKMSLAPATQNPVVIIAAVLVAGMVAGSVALRAHGWWFPLAGLAVAAVLLALPVVLVRSVRYRITNYRIDYERGVFSK